MSASRLSIGYSRSVGVRRGLVFGMFGEQLVELLALYGGGIGDRKGASLAHYLLCSVGANEAIEA